MSHITARAARRAAAVVLPAALLGACSLDVLTPAVVPTGSTVGANALEARLNGALSDFAVGFSGINDGNAGDGLALVSGLFADEYIETDQFDTHRQIDTRSVLPDNATSGGVLRQLYRALAGAQAASDAYVAAGQPTAVGNATALNRVGYEFVLAAENYCSGLPFSRVDAGGNLIYGTPITTQQMLDSAVAKFAAAKTAATGAGTGSAAKRELYAAQVGMGRAQLNLGQFAAAAASVAGVPTSFVYQTEQGTGSDAVKSGNYVLTFLSTRYTTAEKEGTNGLPFVSADDPRLQVEPLGTSDFDASTQLYAPTKYSSYDSPTVIASGVEARLIEAEAAQQAGRFATTGGTIDILNSLRASAGVNPLSAADYATTAAQQNIVFRERAFWLFGTAHRLGDLRRLARAPYSRAVNTVFPTGRYFKGGTYGNQVSLRVPQSESSNPNYNADSCDPTKTAIN